eukprot:CAMPEP_0198280108 /NCGR_PEP_ID=MMETSP1449-20131203/263_1 /TAXON_ID=420275 /ORGANISM="Attheya septentrionalis, Strain CCMP2084" /LENGTH=187 /DNA_ID=CAMNT_0043975381 /DNA_START=81 /DNA_END=644 /DNA_ORIENTATION=+
MFPHHLHRTTEQASENLKLSSSIPVPNCQGIDSSAHSEMEQQEEERKEEEMKAEWRDYYMYRALTDGIKTQLATYYHDFCPGSKTEHLQGIIYDNEKCLENMINTRLCFRSSSSLSLSDMSSSRLCTAQPLGREFGGHHAHNGFSKLRKIRSCNDLFSQSIARHPTTQTDLITDPNLEMEEVFPLDL